ncbi:diguanylate cyclase domain-containing protein [Haliea sp. E17]|uniref:GGDEF domain-containing protein n=1 Tax=Haliea sp. E17 TaxID=3401576 RepID=UPI003AAA840A
MQEEIEGAPPARSSVEFHARRLAEQVSVNRYLYLQTLQMEHMLLEPDSMQGLLEVLLVSLPRHYGFRIAELWLLDPEESLAELIVGGERYGPYLQLHRDAFEMQELYPLEPDIQLIDATDSRMFEVLKFERGIDQALLLPLLVDGRLLGSLHIGMEENSLAFGDEEEDLLAHLSLLIARCLSRAILHQQVTQLTLLDPLTRISNLRGFERDIAREIARARRANQPVSVLLIDVDEYDELHDHYGEVRGHFVLKKVAERISSDLRATDMLARLARARLAVLLPACNESRGEDIAERIRQDIDDFAIDDGRGAVLQVTLSVGMVTWEPQHYPAVDMEQLAKQIETVSKKALGDARARGGNCTAVSRLAPLLV